jgi:nicotinamidase-related amidase
MTSYLLDPEHCALVVIDVQERLLPVIHEADRVVERTCRMVGMARLLGLPMVVTEQYVRGLGPTHPRLRQALSDAEAYHPLEKITFSTFGSEAFCAELERVGRRALLICGIEAHICVLQSVLDALARGYTVHLIEDAVGSRDPREVDRALRRIEACGGVISSLEMAGYELLQRAGTPLFKAARKLLV